MVFLYKTPKYGISLNYYLQQLRRESRAMVFPGAYAIFKDHFRRTGSHPPDHGNDEALHIPSL